MFHGDVEQCPWITYIDYSEDFIIVYIFLEDMNILTNYIWITT